MKIILIVMMMMMMKRKEVTEASASACVLPAVVLAQLFLIVQIAN